MSALTKLEKKVRKSLKGRANTEGDEIVVVSGVAVSTAAWTFLVGPIIEIILSLLDGCLSKSSRDKVTTAALSDNHITRFVVRRAVRRSGLVDSEHYETCENVIRDAYGDEQPGDFLRRRRPPDEALTLQEEVLTISRKVLGPEHPDTLSAMSNLVVCYDAADRWDEGVPLREKLLILSRKSYWPEQQITIAALANSYNNFGFQLPEGRTDEKIDAWQKTLELNPLIKTNAPFFLGELLQQSGKPDEAFIAYLMAIRVGAMPGQAKEKIQGILEDPKNLESCLQAVKSNPDLKLAAFTNFASSGQAEEALSLLDKFSVTKPEETMLAMEAAALQAWFGQSDEYTGFRQRTLAWAADTEDSAVAERVAKLACLMPIEDAKSQAVTLALATRGVELGKDQEEFLPWAQLSLGMAEYRNGQYEQAATTLTTAATTAPKGFRAQISGTANFYRTMCLFQKDQKSEAQALFITTEKTMKPLPANDNNPLADKAYHDHLILWLAYKEAKALLAETETPGE